METVDLKCQNCGGTMEPDENGTYAICEYCGKKQEIKANQNATVNSVSITNTNKSSKSKTIAGLLAIFLGVFGIHNFYLGDKTKGTIQLLLTLIFCWTYIVPIIVWIWTIIEAIRIFGGYVSDSNGNTLS